MVPYCSVKSAIPGAFPLSNRPLFLTSLLFVTAVSTFVVVPTKLVPICVHVAVVVVVLVGIGRDLGLVHGGSGGVVEWFLNCLIVLLALSSQSQNILSA